MLIQMRYCDCVVRVNEKNWHLLLYCHFLSAYLVILCLSCWHPGLVMENNAYCTVSYPVFTLFIIWNQIDK